MKQHPQRFRPVVAAVLAALVVLVAAQPAAAAPRRQRQWYLKFLRISAVHKISTGQGVLVGVVDGGVDAGHPDLAGRVVPGVRVDGGRDSRTDADGHGTHMAGIIAATDAGSDGVLGVAPGARILPVQIPNAGESISEADVAAGIRAAVDRGAKVVNVSIAGGGATKETEAVRYALSKDVVVVAGAGNTKRGDYTVQAPANIPGVIAVTGLNQQGSFWSGSARGAEAVVSAPAQEILNVDSRSVIDTGYSISSGTSDATAIVSGVAALIRAKYPHLDAANVINRIIRTADDAGPAGRDTQYGFGRVDPLRALTANVPAVTSNPLTGEVAATPSAVAADDGGDDKDFDVNQYAPVSGPTERQMMIITIAIIIVVVALLVVMVWLLVRWRRRRRSMPVTGPAVPPGYAAPPPGYGPPQPSYGVPPPGYGAPPPGHAPAPGYGNAPAPGGWDPPRPGGWGPPPPGGSPAGLPNTPSGSPPAGFPGVPPAGAPPAVSPAGQGPQQP